MKLQCPKCGSTAQIELVWVDRESYSNRHYKEYECGCGCHFEAVFELKEINQRSEKSLLFWSARIWPPRAVNTLFTKVAQFCYKNFIENTLIYFPEYDIISM